MPLFQRWTEHIEHPIAILSAGLTSMGLQEVFELGVNAAVSIGVGVVMVVVTHFVKRELNDRYPDKDSKIEAEEAGDCESP